MGINTILIVDDSDGDQYLTKMTIESFSTYVRVHQVYHGQEALNLLSTMKVQPDVILLDINMPVMDGHEFLEYYNEYQDKSPVVFMLTTSNQPVDRAKSDMYSFVKGYLSKPLSVENLEEIENFFE